MRVERKKVNEKQSHVVVLENYRRSLIADRFIKKGTKTFATVNASKHLPQQATTFFQNELEFIFNKKRLRMV